MRIAASAPTMLLGPTLSLFACSAPPLAEPAGAAGDRVVVELLDASFVRVGGARMPWEALVYDLRVKCRELREQGLPAPEIAFVVPAGASVPAAAVDRIQAGLREAGIRHIEMSVADS